MQVKVKKLHPNAVIPSYSATGDAGMDMVAISAEIAEDGSYIEYGTGIAIEIPAGYVGLLFARSSISKTSLILANHVGVVDSGWFAGETAYEVGNKIGQLMILPYPQIELIDSDELSDTSRGEGGFGSTGK